MEARIVMVTAPEGEKTYAMAAELVSSQAAMCVNIIPSVTSIYTWEGKIETGQESLLIIKTPAHRLSELEAKVLALHPYDTPEFMVLKPSEVNDKYLRWLNGAQ